MSLIWDQILETRCYIVKGHLTISGGIFVVTPGSTIGICYVHSTPSQQRVNWFHVSIVLRLEKAWCRQSLVLIKDSQSLVHIGISWKALKILIPGSHPHRFWLNWSHSCLDMVKNHYLRSCQTNNLKEKRKFDSWY